MTSACAIGAGCAFKQFVNRSHKTCVFSGFELFDQVYFGMPHFHDNSRSTSARLVDSRSLSRRTYQAGRPQTKNSRLKASFTYIT